MEIVTVIHHPSSAIHHPATTIRPLYTSTSTLGRYVSSSSQRAVSANTVASTDSSNTLSCNKPARNDLEVTATVVHHVRHHGTPLYSSTSTIKRQETSESEVPLEERASYQNAGDKTDKTGKAIRNV